MSVPESVIAWIREVSGVRVAETRALAGGSHARTHLVRLRDGAEMILRRFPPGDDAALRQTRVLMALGGDPGPELIASDPHGGRSGSPAVLITRMPGTGS